MAYSGQAVFGGTTDPVTGSWTSATTVNSTVVSSDITGYGVIVASFVNTGTVTGGTAIFEVSDDGGTTWWSVVGLQTGTGNSAMTSYALAGGSASFEFATAAYNLFRVRLNPVVTGSGTVAIRLSAEAFPFLTAVAITGTTNVSITGSNAVTQGTSPWVVSLTSTTITGTVAVTQSTSPWVVSLASTTITGTVAVTQSTSPWVVSNSGTFAVQAAQSGNWTTRIVGNAGSTLDTSITANTAPTNGIAVLGVSPSVNPTLSGGQSAALQLSVAGRLNTGVQEWAGSQLAAPQTFGTAPSGIVIGTSSDIYVAGTRARSNQTTTAAGVLDVNIVGSLGVTNSVTNGTFIAITDNTTKVGVIAATTALKIDISSVAGAAVSQSASGQQLVGVVGHNGVVFDSSATPNAAPTNAILTSGVYNTTQPAPASGQAVAVQLDQAANQLIFPGMQFKAGAAWNSATTINTLQYATGTTTLGALTGAGAILVQLNQTTTITGGAVTFQGTYDGTNWVTIGTSQLLNPATSDFTPLTNPYTFVASTNQPFLINLNGMIAVRMNLTTLITGTGSVTPQWSTLVAAPLQPVTVSNLPAAGARTMLAFTMDGVTAPATEGLGTMTINRGGTVTTGTTYTVTTGKTLRLQSTTLAATSTSGTQTFKVRIRAAASVTTTSPLVWLWTSAGGNGVTQPNFVSWSDGIEIAGGIQIAISLLASSTSNTFTIVLNGYEY